jgi:agmatinase
MSRDKTLAPPHRNLWSGLASQDPESEVGVLGIPFDGAVSFRRGTAMAPARIRELTPHLAPCAEEGQPLCLRIHDYGDVALDLEWSRFFDSVEQQALEVFRHALPLFLGGDHSVTIPLMRAFQQAVGGPFGVVHIDAHPDLFDEYEGHRWSHACTERRALELPGLGPEHLVFFGLRSFAMEEWTFLQENPEIQVHTARQCHRQGIEAVAAQAVERLASVPAVYLTLDIDSLDPAYAPGTGTPEGGGLSTRDLLELVRILLAELPVRAMDVVEVAPPLDHGDVTVFAALKTIYEALWVTQTKLAARGELGDPPNTD